METGQTWYRGRLRKYWKIPYFTRYWMSSVGCHGILLMASLLTLSIFVRSPVRLSVHGARRSAAEWEKPVRACQQPRQGPRYGSRLVLPKISSQQWGYRGFIESAALYSGPERNSDKLGTSVAVYAWLYESAPHTVAQTSWSGLSRQFLSGQSVLARGWD